jgi:hypothetical protein
MKRFRLPLRARKRTRTTIASVRGRPQRGVILLRALSLMPILALLAACGASQSASSGSQALSPSTPIAADNSLPAAPAGPFLAPGQQAGDVLVWLSSTPEQPAVGNAQLATTLLAPNGEPIRDAKVTYDTDMTNMSHGPYLVAAEPSGAGRYEGKVHFSMAGPWRVITIIERSGQPAVRLRFEFRVK